MLFNVKALEHERVQNVGSLLTSRSLIVNVEDVDGNSHPIRYDDYEQAVDNGDIRIVEQCGNCEADVVHETRDAYIFNRGLCGTCRFENHPGTRGSR